MTIPRAVRHAIVDHARQERPLECCGFLIGASGRVLFAVPMTNVEKSRARYRIDDRAHIELRRVLRGIRPTVSILGVYHSHPQGAAWPSETDVAEALYPEWVYLIVGLQGSRPVMRGFRIRKSTLRQVPLR
jgi:proteasome lid subunit RPN8/RPN11